MANPNLSVPEDQQVIFESGQRAESGDEAGSECPGTDRRAADSERESVERDSDSEQTAAAPEPHHFEAGGPARSRCPRPRSARRGGPTDAHSIRRQCQLDDVERVGNDRGDRAHADLGVVDAAERAPSAVLDGLSGVV